MSSPSGPSRLRLIPILIAQGFGVACGIAGVKLNSHLLPPETLGIYGVFLTLAPLGMWVVHAGVIKSVGRHWAASPSRPDLLRQAVALWLRRLPWLALLAVPAAAALARMSSPAILAIWLSVFPAAALLVVGALAQSALQAERAHWRDCAVSVSGSATRTFAPLACFVFGGGTLASLWTGFGLHALVFAAAGALALRSYWAVAPEGRRPTPMSSTYRGPLFILLATAGWILSGLNRWLVAGFFGETEAGYFTLAGGAALVISATLGSVFVQFFQPGFFALGDHATGHAPLARRVDRVALGYGVVALSAIGAFALASPLLVGGLIGERYRDALPWILPAGCFGVALLTTGFYQSLLMAGRCEKACGPVELATAAVLAIGCVGSAALGKTWFAQWLIITPLVPWVLMRPMARHYLFREARRGR